MFSFSSRPSVHRTVSFRFGLAVGILFGLLASAGPAVHAQAAQSIGRVEQTETNARSYYYYVEPGASTIRTHVMGTVRYPGLYVVGKGTRLSDLLALSGGAHLEEREQRNRRHVEIRLLRMTDDGQKVVFDTNYEDGRLVAAEPMPKLQDGDILDVEVINRRRFGLRSALTIVNSLALVALAVERLR